MYKDLIPYKDVDSVTLTAINKVPDRPLKSPDDDSTILQGDCLDLMLEIADQSVHLIVTDPPYGLDGMGSDWNAAALDKRKSKAGVVGGLPTGMKFDPKQGVVLQAFFEKVSDQAMRVLYPGAFFLVFSAPRLSHRMATAMENTGFEIRDMYAWHYTRSQAKAFSMDHFVVRMKSSERVKTNILRKLGGRKTAQLRPQFEPIIVGQKPKEGTHINNWLQYETGLIDTKNAQINGGMPSTVLAVEKPIKDKYNSHLTVKPVALIETLIKLFSKKGQIVLDPFVGSGTTLLATRNTGRQGIGIEINKEYIDIINQRLGVRNHDQT